VAALRVRPEESLPRRGDEYERGVPLQSERVLERIGRNQSCQLDGRRYIDKAAIKESPAAQPSMPIEVAYRSFGTQIYEALGVHPRKAIPASLGFVLHDLPPRLGYHDLAALCEGRDQRGFARPGAT